MKVEGTVFNVYMTLSRCLYCIPTIWTLHFDGFIINPLKNAQLQSFLFINLIYNLLEETQETVGRNHMPILESENSEMPISR